MGIFDATGASRETSLTPEQREQVNDVLDAAVGWQSNRLPLVEAANVGLLEVKGRPSAAYTRHLAVVHTPHGDPRRGALLSLIDRLISLQGNVVTDRGVFERRDVTSSVRVQDDLQWAQ